MSDRPDSRDIRAELHSLRQAREEELRARHDRSLPFAEGLFDRWERAKHLGFDDGASIYDSAFVFGDVKAGKQTWIGPYTILDGSGGGISIGDTCSISAGVHIYTHDTVRWALSAGVCGKKEAAVEIGDCCYIGPQAIIVAGVTIGSQCVIGANSYVGEDVPDRTFVAGSPARVVGRVEGSGEDVKIKVESDSEAGA